MTHWLEKLLGETQARVLRLMRRSGQTITALARSLKLTDNAVRTHIAALRHDGFVTDIGAQRDTGGKPARVYGLTAEGEELFPKAYAPVLGMLIEEVAQRDGRERAVELLRAVGRRLASGVKHSGDTKQRLAAAAQMFRDLGADVDVRRTADGWQLRGHGCPLSAVTTGHEEVCELGKALIEEITGETVAEHCERGEHPCCAFAISA